MNDLMAATAVCLYMQQTTQRPKYCFFFIKQIIFFNVFSHTNKQERVRQQQKKTKGHIWVIERGLVQRFMVGLFGSFRD